LGAAGSVATTYDPLRVLKPLPPLERPPLNRVATTYDPLRVLKPTTLPG